MYTEQDELDVATDNGIRVGQSATAEFMLHQFKDFVGEHGSCTLTWNGQSTLAPSTSPVFLQVFNRNLSAWETVVSNNEASADTDFTLTFEMLDLTNHKDASNVIACRVYQGAI